MQLTHTGNLEKIVEKELKTIAPRLGLLSIVPLTGDASNRFYYRLFINGFKKKSVILMKLNVIDRGIMSEEIVNLHRKFTEIPFLNIQRFLYKINVKVPELYLYSAKNSMIFIEDFGDKVMFDMLKEQQNALRDKLYRLAIEQLIKMQFDGIKRKNDDCYAFWHSFDVKLMMWEFMHFIEFAIAKRNKKMHPEHSKKAEEIFRSISDALTLKMHVFTHRDYHSKNLMVMENELGILDFQDALLGPPHYDLASLLRDSYTELEEKFIYNCVKYYIDKVRELYGIKFEYHDFVEKFDLMSIQRNLKAAGRFHYIDIVKKNPNYLQFVPGTLKKVKRNLLKYEWLQPLHDILAEYVDELR